MVRAKCSNHVIFKIRWRAFSCKYEKPPFWELTGWIKGEEADCGLHPLIHTRLKFNLAQDMVSCQRNKKSPH
jgi:hypothetical protein